MAQGKRVLAELGMDRIWHPLLIRFGANTLKTFKQRSDGDPVLGDDDIFFIDMGVVWQGHEGDAGTTFTTGADPQMRACAGAAKTLFDQVESFWRSERVCGVALYDFARAQAQSMGWKLNLDIKGHRVSDFPMRSIAVVTWGISPNAPIQACGFWRSSLPTRICLTVRSTRTC